MGTKKQVVDALTEALKLANELPADVVPKPPARTDEELAAIIRTEFLRRTIPNGYTATTGYPGASTPMGEVNIAMRQWVAEFRRVMSEGGDVTTLYPKIDADVKEYFGKKTETPTNPGGGGGTTNPGGGTTNPGGGGGKDEVLTVDLIKSWMNPRLGHEVLPSIYEDFPDWGIFDNVTMDPNVNTNPAYPAVPATISTRHRIMGWLVVAGINRKPNTAKNAATKIIRAVTMARLRDGSIQMVEGLSGDGELTHNRTMVYTGQPIPMVRDKMVAGLGRTDIPWKSHNWHPTIRELDPRRVAGARSEELRDSVRTTLTFYSFQARPIDTSQPFDVENLNNSTYGGQDNYGNGARQDGISGRFLQVQPWVRFNGTWWGEESDLQALIDAYNGK